MMRSLIADDLALVRRQRTCRTLGSVLHEIHHGGAGAAVIDAEVQGTRPWALCLTGSKRRRLVWIPELLIGAHQAARARIKRSGIDVSLLDQRGDIFAGHFELDLNQVVHSIFATDADEARRGREPQVELCSECGERFWWRAFAAPLWFSRVARKGSERARCNRPDDQSSGHSMLGSSVHASVLVGAESPHSRRVSV